MTPIREGGRGEWGRGSGQLWIKGLLDEEEFNTLEHVSRLKARQNEVNCAHEVTMTVQRL